ncbi:Kelch repeat-containing protein [Candidatus Leptofilum sp.]|uniref:Kelch repeat-containing protein n=1 Tax=Candidatus Leptofilum sp. TaxID=3241576 RepID=UPI003B59D81F
MRHLTFLLSILLLCLGIVNIPTPAPAVVAAAPSVVPGALPVQKMTLQPLPEAPLIATAAADSCSNATTITLNGSGVGETTVVNSMTEGSEDPVLTCAWGSPSRPEGYRTVWYQFTPTSNGRVTIDTANNFNPNSYDTILAVHTGSCGAATLDLVACNDDYQGFASRVTFNVSKDVTYFVEVADWNAAEPGTLELDIFFVLDPIPTKWATLAAAGPARARHASVNADGQIYVLGGQTNAVGTPDIEAANTPYRYNPALDSWTPLAPMPDPKLTDVTAAYLNGRIFIPGGYDGNSMVGSHHVFSVGAGLWEPDRDPPPVAVGWAQAVVPDDEGGYYLIGGISNTDFLQNSATVHNDVSFFSLSTNTWITAIPDMDVPRYGHTAVWTNDGIYVVGGIDDNNQLLPGGEYYQPAGNGQWDPLPPMNIARYGASSAVAPDGKWYVFGGLDFSNSAVPEVEMFDPLNPGAGWQILDVTYDLGGTTTLRARAFPEGQFVGNYLYVTGGYDTIDYAVTSTVQRLLLLGETNYLPIILDGANQFNDNFSVAQRLQLNVAQTHQFNGSFDFFDAFYFDQLSADFVTIRLSQIPSGSDYNVTIYDTDKSVRGSGTLAGNQSEAVTLLLPTGRYYVMVERIFGQSDGSNYRIIVEE